MTARILPIGRQLQNRIGKDVSLIAEGLRYSGRVENADDYYVIIKERHRGASLPFRPATVQRWKIRTKAISALQVG